MQTTRTNWLLQPSSFLRSNMSSAMASAVGSAKGPIIGTAIGLSLSLVSSSVIADVWVFEPSVTLDTRLDDNYFLITSNNSSLSATRAVGELGLSRRSPVYSIKGIARIDGLLTTSSDVGDEDLDSNQIFVLDANRGSARRKYGLRLNLTRDTPSRDIAADISDDGSIAEDTGLVVNQSLLSNVTRVESVAQAYYEYDFTRRLQLNTDISFTQVDHDLPSVQNTVFQRYLDTLETNPDGSFVEEPLPFDEVTIETLAPNDVFTASGELDDFSETEIGLGFRYKLSPIATLSFSGDLSFLSADVPVNGVSFENQIPDERERRILRNPTRDSDSITTTFILGYERQLSEVLRVSVNGGVFTNETDVSDSFDVLSDEQTAALGNGKTSTDGWVAGVGVTYDDQRTQYTAAFSVDVEPSSAGSQVETNELTGRVVHTWSPRLKLSLSGRAFEPDRLGAIENDSFARRFISIEPKVQWDYSRTVTLSAAYRYRRQKSRINPASAESNAVLLALKYTPASEVRDRALF